MNEPWNTQQAATAAGISTMTLQRWIALGKVKAPKLQIRNGRAVRLWHEADIVNLLSVKQTVYRKGRGRKRGYKRK